MVPFCFRTISFSIALTICIMCIFFSAHGQATEDIIKYRTKSLKIKVENGQWSPKEPCDILIVIRGKTITIYSKKIQKFDIVRIEDEPYHPELGENVRLICVDQDGIECAMSVYKKRGLPYVWSVGYLDYYYIYELDND